MYVIAQKSLPSVDGFTIGVGLVPDEETTPNDYDCYSDEDKAAWLRDRWSFVTVVVAASRSGVRLGLDTLTGVEHGTLSGGEADGFDAVVPNKMVETAVAEARATLRSLNAPDLPENVS